MMSIDDGKKEERLFFTNAFFVAGRKKPSRLKRRRKNVFITVFNICSTSIRDLEVIDGDDAPQ